MASRIRMDGLRNECSGAHGECERHRNLPGRFGRKPEPESGRSAIRAAVAGALALCASACSETYVDMTPDAARPSACESVSASTRCDIGTPTHERCMVYKGNAVEMDGILFTAKDIAPEGRETDFDYEIRDKLLKALCAARMPRNPRASARG